MLMSTMCHETILTSPLPTWTQAAHAEMHGVRFGGQAISIQFAKVGTQAVQSILPQFYCADDS